MTERQISDEVCIAALRGWNGWEPDADLSKVQTAPETMAAWRRAISAAIGALEQSVGKPTESTLPQTDVREWLKKNT